MTTPYRHARRTSRALPIPPVAVKPPPEPGIVRRLLTPPDSLQLDAGASGELLVARVRLLLVLLLLPIPLTSVFFGNNISESAVGLSTNLAALTFSWTLYYILKRGFYRPWLGFATSLMDVSFVSAALGVFLLLNAPHTTVNSRPTFEVYFLAIGATSLRYDTRISLAAGLLAIVEYTALVLIATTFWDLNDPRYAPFPYGLFDWPTQISRLILLGVASLLAGAIVLRSQGLRRLSRSDRLTGLPNRGYFDERVQAELSRARRYNQPLSMAMIDVDLFKRFNDSHGHAAGDQALRLVARCILDSIRQSDLVVRYGGEEFVAVFPGMDPEAAFERVEAIRKTVAEVPMPLPRRGNVAHLTISAGIAVYGADGTTAEDLLDKADDRLFMAKEAGRNRVVGPTADTPAGS
jgi:diguanylate cyclase (GGDEF)-like protein